MTADADQVGLQSPENMLAANRHLWCKSSPFPSHADVCRAGPDGLILLKSRRLAPNPTIIPSAKGLDGA